MAWKREKDCHSFANVFTRRLRNLNDKQNVIWFVLLLYRDLYRKSFWPRKNICYRVVWLVLIATSSILAEAAIPDPPNSKASAVNPLKLSTAVDCTGVIAFSATHASVDVSILNPSFYIKFYIKKGKEKNVTKS